MMPQSCHRTAEVRAALTAGQWTNDVLEHALDCEVCSALLMTACLAERARVEMSRPVLLDADVLWWKAQLRAGRRDSRRALAPIIAAQMIALAGGAVALIPVVTALRAMLMSEPLSSTSMESLGSIAVLLFAFLLSVARSGIDRRTWRVSR